MSNGRSNHSRCIRLQDINDLSLVGGKAAGLAELLGWGLSVPAGFVIIDAQNVDHEELVQYYQSLQDLPVAVRSSAIGEDGIDTSFAGQYETVLNVSGFDALIDAIKACTDSFNNERASAYQSEQGAQAESMCVVVQQMVDAATAGVLFSVDPVSGRHDRLIIDVVEGLGEALVSGEKTPDHYEYDFAASCVYQELVTDKRLLTEEQCQQLIQGARRATAAADMPLDMEWAFDQHGVLHWLQARPITTVGSDLNELDTPIKHGDILTRCNVGEMMPGASCPLTFATTGKAIEYGMQHMHYSYASRPEITEEWTQIANSHGRLFINLSGAAAAASTVFGVDVKSLGQSVCGRVVEGLENPPKRSVWTRIGGMIKLLMYLKHADAVIDEFTQRVNQLSLPTQGDSRDIAIALDEVQPLFYEAFCVHLQSSTTSGFASNILQAMISGGQDSTPEEEAEAARLMAGASGVESAVLVEQLDEIVRLIAQSTTEDKTLFVESDTATALLWLQSQAPEPVREQYTAFMQRHGHRCYRELCVREQSWADAPMNLIATMQASVKASLTGLADTKKPEAVDLASLSRGLRWILPKAHNAIRRREKTKSQLVFITNQLKRSYRALGQSLAADGLLDDADLVFFLTHDELIHYVNLKDGNAARDYWNHKALARRKSFEYQDRLEFDEICYGRPQPLDPRQMIANSDGGIIGRPVSQGLIEARARVALTVADAASLEAGEILVAPITDVGWTPYFRMIAGLVTDVGSSVSHGAVIAREYGLPAIVNTRTGTSQIRTGDLIRLDAHTGVVTVLESAS